MERKERERSDAARIAEDASDTAGRYKEAVARLTADNMIFLMKVRTSRTSSLIQLRSFLVNAGAGIK